MTSAVRRRRLARLADGDGLWRVLAIDHRDSLRVVVDSTRPESVPLELLRAIKVDLVRAAGELVSGAMLDPEIGMDDSVVGAVPPAAGIIASLEAQGYLSDNTVTHTTLLDGWGPEQAAARGADAVKLLALWNGNESSAQRAVIEKAVDSSHRSGLPLVLEPLPRGLPPSGEWVVDWARLHRESGADLFKVPDPGSRRAAGQLTEILPAPWAVLSAGVDFETFLDQLRTAVSTGAVGFIAGRTVWREAATADPHGRHRAIQRHVLPRLERLAEVV